MVGMRGVPSVPRDVYCSWGLKRMSSGDMGTVMANLDITQIVSHSYLEVKNSWSQLFRARN